MNVMPAGTAGLSATGSSSQAPTHAIQQKISSLQNQISQLQSNSSSSPDDAQRLATLTKQLHDLQTKKAALNVKAAPKAAASDSAQADSVTSDSDDDGPSAPPGSPGALLDVRA